MPGDGAFPSLAYHPLYTDVRSALKAAAEEYGEAPAFEEVEEAPSLFAAVVGTSSSPTKKEAAKKKKEPEAEEEADSSSPARPRGAAEAAYGGSYRFHEGGLGGASPLENEATNVGYYGGPLDDDLYMDAPDLPLGGDAGGAMDEALVRPTKKKGRRCCGM